MVPEGVVMLFLTQASSVAQGLTHCNKCGECCRNPCLLKDAVDVAKLGAFLGKSTREMLQSLRITKNKEGHVFVSPRRGDNGFCEFYDNGCSVHEVKPAGGADFECWTPERGANDRTCMFAWDESDLMKLAKEATQ